MNKNYLKISFIYIGTIIGAGFASGREILDFFGVYGLKGFLGIGISGILFSLIGSFLLLKVHKNNIKNYRELINNLFGEKIGFIVDTIITFSLFTGFCVMLSGSGAIFHEEFGLSQNIGIYLMSSICFIVFLFSLKGLSFINSVLVPILIIGILFIGVNVILKEGLSFSNIDGVNLTNKGNIFTSSFLYVSFNILLVFVVFSSLGPLIEDKKTAIKSGLFGGIILGILGIFILFPLLIYYSEVYLLEIPMFKVTEYVGGIYRKYFSIIIWIAMFTTAIANGFGFNERILKGEKNPLFSLLFCLLSIPFAKLGFSNLVHILYPIYGYIGGIIIIIMVIKKIY